MSTTNNNETAIDSCGLRIDSDPPNRVCCSIFHRGLEDNSRCSLQWWLSSLGGAHLSLSKWRVKQLRHVGTEGKKYLEGKEGKESSGRGRA